MLCACFLPQISFYNFSFLLASVHEEFPSTCDFYPRGSCTAFKGGANAGCTHWFLVAANSEGNAGLQCKLLLIK